MCRRVGASEAGLWRLPSTLEKYDVFFSIIFLIDLDHHCEVELIEQNLNVHEWNEEGGVWA